MAREAAGSGQSRGAFELTKFLPFRLTVLTNRLNRRVARLYSERFGLTAPEWRTMAVLGHSGAMSANAVIERTTMDKVRVSRAVAKLLKAGYITRDSDPDDRRRAILALTPRGMEIYREVVPLVQEVESEILALLSQNDRASLDGALARLESFLGDAKDDEADSDE